MSNRDLAEAIDEALNARGARGKPPVPLQALIAGVIICSQEKVPSRIGMAKVAGYSYGSSQKHYAALLTTIVDKVPTLVSEMTAGEIDANATARLTQELRQRDETIAHLRQELRAHTERQEHVKRYALALHERLRFMEEQAAAEGGAYVVPLHPLP
ncbi:hypothetical protein [Nesterenkonia sp. CF4.4]|uniref:hypothetical protein n=1 Tax=Nesterenkonia sp. CF4.4 TaxID=3373079 RepID=UPI003EE4C827